MYIICVFNIYDGNNEMEIFTFDSCFLVNTNSYKFIR